MSTSLDEKEKLKELFKAAIIEVLEERGAVLREAADGYEAPRGIERGEQGDFTYLAEQGLAGAYGPDEPEYSLDLIKEPNPEYERR